MTNAKKISLAFIVGFSLVLSAVVPSKALTNAKNLPGKYKKWLNEEVTYIITPTEKEVFLKLQNNKERNLFIEAFWKHRDPTVGTEKNEYRDEHYRRLDYANRRFRSPGKPGWKSDRGKVYIILGEPKNIRLFHATDAYYPAESWYYQGLKMRSLPQAFTLLFYQKGRTGEYIIYNPAVDGPWSLMSNYWGSQGDYQESYYALANIEPELAQLSISLIPGESIINFPSLSSSELIQNIDIAAINMVKDKYAEKFIQYKDTVEVEYSTNYIESHSRAQIIQDDSGINYVHFSIEPQNINMGSFQNSIYTNLEFNGIVMDQQGKTIFQFEKAIPLKFTGKQFQKMRRRPFNFTDVFPLIPGDYKFSLLVKNSVSKEFTSFETELNIPADSTLLRMSPLLLGFNTAKAASPDSLFKPFVVDNTQLYFQTQNMFVSKDRMFIFFQIFNLPKSLSQKGTLRYSIFKEEEEADKFSWPLSKYPDKSNFLEMIPLEKFVPGYYKLKVSLLDEKGKEAAFRQENFIISPVDSLPRPWVIGQSLIASGKPQVYSILGRQLINKKDYKNALLWLEKAHRIDPENFDYGFHLAQAYFYLKHFDKTLEVLSLFSEKGKSLYEFQDLRGKSFQALSRFDKAVEIFDNAIARFGVNTSLLNSLGECYSQLGNKKEALAAYEKSLELNPNQEGIKMRVQALKK